MTVERFGLAVTLPGASCTSPPSDSGSSRPRSILRGRRRAAPARPAGWPQRIEDQTAGTHLGRLALCVCTCVLVTLAGCGNRDQASAGAGAAYRSVVAALQPFILDEMADKKLTGLSIALVDDQNVVWAKGFGSVRPETLYPVGSITQLFTAVAAMQLVERGDLGLDSPIYPGRFQGERRFVTLGQLLAHRAGLPREPPLGSVFDSSGVPLGRVVQSLSRTELIYPPGTRTKYSNAGMVAAGDFVGSVRGDSYERYLARAVLEPMGLRHTMFRPDHRLARALAKGHLWSYDGRVTAAPTARFGSAPASGLYSTVIDLARFASVLFAGGRGPGGQVLRPETIERMWTAEPVGAGSPADDFGLGFWVRSVDGRRQVGRRGSHYGYATDLELIPRAKLAAVISTTEDQANGVIAKIADTALGLMLAVKQGRAVGPLATTAPVPAELAKRLDGRYVGRAGGSADLEEHNGRLIYHRPGGEAWFSLRMLGDTLVVDDRLAFGERIVPLGDRILIGRDTLSRVEAPKPPPALERWRGLVGEYGPDYNVLYVREEEGRLHALIHWFFDYPLVEESPDVYRFPDAGLYRGERLTFSRDGGGGGRATEVRLSGVGLPRRHVAPEDGSTFRITPLKPADELLRAALAAMPPAESGELPPDLVEVARVDPAIKLDLRYATSNNFVGVAFYEESRAFLQRPAAEALIRASRRLRREGYGVLIHDAYRPWYVTRMFWDATPQDKKVFVANPATGSRHNRGCAVDLTLYELRTGKPVEMVSGYDEFSDRAYPDYPGGTSLQRWHRKLLRRAMEAEGFTVYEAEWWHFDYKDWRRYPVINLRFEELGRSR